MFFVKIIEQFEKTVEKFRDKESFIGEDRSATFGEVMANAKAIATYLSQFGTQKPVAILIEKSCNCVDSMIGVNYANDFHIVLDCHSPEDRLHNIIKTFDDPIIIADEKTKELADSLGYDYVMYEEIVATEVDEDILSKIRVDMCDMDTAYIIFTSGSTGLPKGTVINHRALMTYLHWVNNQFDFNEKTIFGSQAQLYFSACISDFWTTVTRGCTYCMIPKACFLFPMSMITYLNEHKVNTIYWVPTALVNLANWKVFDVAKPEYLKLVLFVGEVMPTKQLNYWINNLDKDITYANMYGPTETVDLCTYYIIDRKFEDHESLPIGKHCDNCDVFMLTDDGRRGTIGDEGELYIRTSYMSDGYYRNPEKTAEAFVQNPLHNNFPERVYKTGDIVRYNDRGELVFIARTDFQIKRMGYRIELGEIEAAANSVDKVKACAVVFDKEADCLALVYEGGVKDTMVVYNAVKSKVPSYMVPDKVLRIKEMPKNTNGKTDRKALQEIYKTL